MSKDKCIFCDLEGMEKLPFYNRYWTTVFDGYPVSKGHTLIIPNRHVETYFDLNREEIISLIDMIDYVKEYLDESFHPQGYNIGVNCGKASGQTIPHCHIHIIPRYEGDVEDPRGGIRGVIPNKQKY